MPNRKGINVRLFKASLERERNYFSPLQKKRIKWEWSLCSKVSKSIKINSDFILFEKVSKWESEKNKCKLCTNKCVQSENLMWKLEKWGIRTYGYTI